MIKHPPYPAPPTFRAFFRASFRNTFTAILTVLIVLWSGVPSAVAQQTGTAPTGGDIRDELQRFGNIDLFVFRDRAAFLARMDETLGLANIKDPDKTFAKLPRSPFTVTGQQNGQQIATCQIFVPENVTPQSGNEIFAELMRGWFGKRLSYGTDPAMTYRWLIYHEIRHCQPDHFGGDDIESHRDERDADLFALDQIATSQNRDGLIADIIAFRMITSALFADRSHMTGLSVRYALDPASDGKSITTDQEVAAFLATRRMIGAHAKAIAANVTPTNLELVRAITELRSAAEAGTLTPVIAHAPEILIGLDDAIAHFAPTLHARVATKR